MATITAGYVFGATEEVTATKLGKLASSGGGATTGTMAVTNIAAADIADLAITDAKISSVGGSKFTGLENIPSGSGVIPIANLPTIPIANGGTGAITAQLGLNALAGAVTANRLLKGNGTNIVLAQADLTTDVTGTLPVGNGGTGATAAANAASGVVVLNASSQLPAVSGALLTGLNSYDSGWFAVTKGTKYTKTHNLGTTKVICFLYFSTSSDGSTDCYSPWMGNYQDAGSCIKRISATEIDIQTSINWVMATVTDAGVWGWVADGYMRIIVIRV